MTLSLPASKRQMGNANGKIEPITSRLPYGKKCGGAYKIFVLTGVLLIGYIIILKTISRGEFYKYDILNNIAMEVPAFGKLSYWPISHFILFLILGLLFPNCDIVVISIGIIWELIEELFGYFFPGPKLEGRVQYETWWSGSLTDIVFNILGFYTGKMIAYLVGLAPENMS